MRLWVERLRWGLAVAALLLIAVLVILLGYGRYRAVKAWRQIVARSGATITHEAHEITYSQAVGGRTVFTIHAADALPHGDGKYTLRNVVLLLYGADGKRVDRISGAEFDYDQKNEVARALGDVHMDLQAPEGLSSGVHEGQPGPAGGTHNEVAETPETIHVRTSGLVYMRKLGVAATDQPVEIAYHGVEGHARGAEFDAAQSTVHLLADVHIDGTLHGEPTHLTASKADLVRDSDLIRLTQPRVQSGSGTLSDVRADQAVVHLRRDGSVEQIQAHGSLSLHSGTTSMHAESLNASMNGQSLLQRAELAGGVQVNDDNQARSMHGVARTLTIMCDREGTARNVIAQGAVSIQDEQRRAGSAPLERQMAAERVALSFRGSGRNSWDLSAIEATGGAWVRGESVTTGATSSGKRRMTQLAGDTVRLNFAENGAGKDEPQLLTASGHTRLSQTNPDGAQESSTGDSLIAHFAAAERGVAHALPENSGLRVVSAEQAGHVRLRSQPAPAAHAKTAMEVTEANAEHATLDGTTDRLTLTGRPSIQRDGTCLSANTIILSQASGDAEAHGDISGTFASADYAPGTALTHVMARDATLKRGEQTAEFRGTDAQAARIWQGASQIEAASLLLNRAQDRLAARPSGSGGLVHAVFAGTSGPSPVANGTRPQRPHTGSGERVIRVSSAKLDYSGASREAIFTGGVRAEAAGGQIQGSQAVVFLSKLHAAGEPATQGSGEHAPESALGGAVEKVVFSGSVRLEQAGRKGTGQQLLYTAATQQFVLTGAPGHLPRISDANQGSVTGGTLLFGAADSTIVVAGEPGAHGQPQGRVHTETVVKP